MRIIVRRTLRDFWKLCSRAEQPLKAWFVETSKANWVGPEAIRAQYPHASFVAKNRVIFNIGGSKFRLVTDMNYEFGVVYIKFVCTHSDYHRIDPETV